MYSYVGIELRITLPLRGTSIYLYVHIERDSSHPPFIRLIICPNCSLSFVGRYAAAIRVFVCCQHISLLPRIKLHLSIFFLKRCTYYCNHIQEHLSLARHIVATLETSLSLELATSRERAREREKQQVTYKNNVIPFHAFHFHEYREIITL